MGTRPFYLEINYLVVLLRCVHWTDNSHKKQDWEGACQGSNCTVEVSDSKEQKGSHLPRQVTLHSRWSRQCWQMV